MKWATLASNTRPELAELVAVPNGGLRHIRVAQKLKAEGVAPGYPDLLLDVARGGHHGLRIEMKSQTGRLSPEQIVWLNRLNARGYKAVMCKGWLEAKQVLEDYLDLQVTVK